MTCQHCYGGYVRKFKGKRGKRKAMFYDETCPVCKGDWHKPDRRIYGERLPKVESIQPNLFEQIACPF